MTKIVIVGGGVSGLSAGIYARKEGYDVTTVEDPEKLEMDHLNQYQLLINLFHKH